MTAPKPMPAVFVGHGSPMNALPGSPYAASWRAVGEGMPRPKAILMVSAHWETQGTRLTGQAAPPTIHDFRGFPQALFDMRYPAPGAPELLEPIQALLAPSQVVADSDWGFDHGAWSVLAHMYPAADIPVAQLSLDRRLTGMQHYALAKRLRPLRDQGVLILGSGNVVHNLRAMQNGPAHPWAERFDARIQAALLADDIATVAAIEDDEDARLSAPDHEHYWPILYIAAQRGAGEALTLFNQGAEMGAISMTSFVVGV